MRTGRLLFAGLMSAVALGALQGSGAAEPAVPKTNLQLTMLTKVNVYGLALWDITNGAMDARAAIDASKLKEVDWARLIEIGRALEEGGRALASRNGIVVAAPGAKLQDEGNADASSAADVQRYVDAKPEVFRQHAQALQKTGAGVMEAARKRDARQLGDLSNSLDAVCENCHVTFWYPQLTK
ncbi:MAG: hypothetical protein QM718_06625 [Steroidobacteraceae bacterium]